MIATETKQVGYLIARAAICNHCAEEYIQPKRLTVPLHDVNIKPYRQRCAICRTTMIAGIDGFPELWD
jgi:hypothetical protein